MEEENRMKKSHVILAAGLLGLLACAGFSIATEDKGPADIVLKSTVDPAKKAKPAFFPHGIHQSSFTCEKCHHKVGQTNLVKCETCHNKAEVSTGMPEKVDTFKKAAHEMCKGCHKELSSKGQKGGPTKCNGCHRKDLK